MFYNNYNLSDFLKRSDTASYINNTNVTSKTTDNTLEDFEKAFKKKYGIDFEVFVKKFKEQFPEEML